MTSQSSSPLPYIEVGSGIAGDEGGFRAISETLAPLYESTIDRDFERRVPVALKTWLMGPLILGVSEMGGLDFAYGRSARKIAHDAVDAIVIDIVMDGGEVRLGDDADSTARPGDLFILDMNRPFAARSRTHSSFHLAIPRSLFDRSDPEMTGLHERIIRGGTAPAALLTSHIKTLWQQGGNMRSGDVAAIARGTMDLVSGLIVPEPARDDETRAVSHARILTVKRFIERHLSQPDLGPALLCRQFGLSRAGLYRLFGPLGGVAGYIRQRRLRRVFDDLSSPLLLSRLVAEIAYGWGFVDLSAFARAFKAEFAMTPSEARDFAARPDFWHERATDPSHHGHAFPQWLKAMDNHQVG